MSSILQELEQEIANVTTSVGKTNVGIIPWWSNRSCDEP